MDEKDRNVRWFLHDTFVRTGRAPSIEAIAKHMNGSVAEAESSLHRLEDRHALTLAPTTAHLWMIHPFSAVPTAYPVVRLGRGGDSGHSRARRPRAREMRRERRRDPAHVSQRRARRGRRRRSLRRSAPSLLGQRRLHLSDHSSLPVGRTGESLVRSHWRGAGVHDAGCDHLAARKALVRRPLAPGLGAEDLRTVQDLPAAQSIQWACFASHGGDTGFTSRRSISCR